MPRVSRANGYLGSRTSKAVETRIKQYAVDHHKETTEILNYLYRCFLNDVGKIQTKFIKECKGGGGS